MEAWQAESSSSAKSETRNGRSRGRRAVYVLTVETCSGSCTSTLSDKPTPSSSCPDYPQGTRRARVQSMLNRLLVLATPPTFNRAMQSWNSRAQVFNLNKWAMEGGRAAVPTRISSSSLPIVIPSSLSSSTTVPAGKQFSSLALCLPIVVVSDVRRHRCILCVDLHIQHSIHAPTSIQTVQSQPMPIPSVGNNPVANQNNRLFPEISIRLLLTPITRQANVGQPNAPQVPIAHPAGSMPIRPGPVGPLFLMP